MNAGGGPKQYHRLKYTVFLSDLALGACLLAILQFTPLGDRFVRTAESFSAHRPLQVAIYMFFFFTAFYAASFPLSLYSGHALEQRFGLTDQRLGGWLRREAKKGALSLALFVPMMTALFFVGDLFPRTWWIWAGAGWFAFTAVLTRVLPTLILPIFYKSEPLGEGPLNERLLELCRRHRVRVLGAFRLALSKTTRKANAALVGTGKSRRILLADTLLEAYPEDEVAMVVAHELGHHVRHHIARGLVFNGVLAIGGFWALKSASDALTAALGGSSLTDLSIFPALAFLSAAAGLAALPAQNAYSRRLEREADRFALACYPSAQTFRSLMERLSRQNLGDADPHPLVEAIFYSHPSLNNRLRHAKAVLRAEGHASVS